MFYDKFLYLCKQKGISPSRAALEAGISKSLVTKWKTNNVQDPSADIARKLASYFGISVAELLGEKTERAPTVSGERPVSDDDIKFALFGGSGEITEAMYDEVRRFAAYVRQREAEKKE